jgi:hypothetical protein
MDWQIQLLQTENKRNTAVQINTLLRTANAVI